MALVLSFVMAFVFSIPATSYAYYGYEYVDQNCHRTSWGGLEQHWWTSDGTTQPATLFTNGMANYTCYYCDAKKTDFFGWTLTNHDSDYCSYNIYKHSIVYPKSKSITVWLENPIAGSLVKVKIGKKTYKKRVWFSNKVKIKIKKPKYGNRISMDVSYGGRRIGTMWDDEDDVVYYSKNIKKGMTKKQVRYLYYWGGTDDTASASGGWSYWYYDDGSYIGFKNGRVRFWYDAAG